MKDTNEPPAEEEARRLESYWGVYITDEEVTRNREMLARLEAAGKAGMLPCELTDAESTACGHLRAQGRAFLGARRRENGGYVSAWMAESVWKPAGTPPTNNAQQKRRKGAAHE